MISISSDVFEMLKNIPVPLARSCDAMITRGLPPYTTAEAGRATTRWRNDRTLAYDYA